MRLWYMNRRGASVLDRDVDNTSEGIARKETEEKKKQVGYSRSEKRTLHGETDDVMVDVCSKNPSAPIREKDKDVREGRKEDLDGCRVEVVIACWR